MTDNNNQLSERELEILEMVATGASNKEIALKLSISANTVKVHLRNIFTKIDVSSRTEATMWAVRNGLIQPFPEGELPIAAEKDQEDRAAESRSSNIRWAAAGAVLVIALGVLLAIWLVGQSRAAQPEPTTAAEVVVPPATILRWQSRASMPDPRAAQAVTTYEGNVYVIGGQSGGQVSGGLEAYLPEKDQWQMLTSKPTPVKDVQAAVIGGKVYVPGGLTNQAMVTDVLEIYDTLQDRWDTGPNLPHALSSYAMVSFEGRLYLFGGWDGSQYRSEVYAYIPATGAESGRWLELTAMPVARGFAGAAVSGGKIYVIGGIDAQDQVLSRSDVYTPAMDDGQNSPWQPGMPLPESRYHHAMTSVGDLVFVIGGIDANGGRLTNLQFSPAANLWQRIENPIQQAWTDLGVATVGTQLFTFGGEIGNQESDLTQTYQAIFTIAVPFAP
jgi:DNA-binding CsgD family transcriptional regulator/N-acetylneuraminic acid mutarotase